MKNVNKFNEAYRSVIKEQRYTNEDNPFTKACEELNACGYYDVSHKDSRDNQVRADFEKSLALNLRVEVMVRSVNLLDSKNGVECSAKVMSDAGGRFVYAKVDKAATVEICLSQIKEQLSKLIDKVDHADVVDAE